MAPPPNPFYRTDIFDALKLLTPFDILGANKIRVGPNSDGGYVMLDMFGNCRSVLSFGISTQVEFDADVADRGINVYMYDHTILNLPYERSEFNFRRLGIGPANHPAQNIYSLDYHLEADGLQEDDNLILKMDVEGAEYASIIATPDETLAKFSQIVVELHDLSKMGDPQFFDQFIAFMTKLLKNHIIFHVHGNNCMPINIIDGMPIADVLEISLVRAGMVDIIPSTTVYPTKFDYSNASWAADHMLWFFPFLPTDRSNDETFRASRRQSEEAVKVYAASYHEAEHEAEVALANPVVEVRASARRFEASVKRKILYFSCHQILEYDDLRMLTDAGHKVFSIGDFLASDKERLPFRAARPEFFDADLHDEFLATGCNFIQRTVTPEFVRHFDLIIVTHYNEWVNINLDAFGDKPVIIRTIGQSRRKNEREYAKLGKRVKIVRYSEREAELPGFARTDDVIYFAKYPGDFNSWVGGDSGSTFFNNFLDRDGTVVPSPAVWRMYNGRTLSRLYGYGNDRIERSSGLAAEKDIAEIFQKSSSYLYVHSFPPSYTLNFMEAMLAGCPIIAPSTTAVDAVGMGLDYEEGWSSGRYEVPSFLTGGCGITFDNINEAVLASHWLEQSPAAGMSISTKSVARARELFDVEKIYPQWDRFFNSIC